MIEFVGLVFLVLFLFMLYFIPIVDAMFPNADARLKSTVKWEDENMTNKERVAKWRQEQKKND